jgi:quercetin dioxygenase-like cupin family protein
MVDGECFWPEKVSVGEVVYPPGGTFGPRQQRNLQLVMVRSGHLTVWIGGMPRTATANTVGVLFPGHEERFAFLKRNPRHGIAGCTSFAHNFQRRYFIGSISLPGLCHSLLP